MLDYAQSAQCRKQLFACYFDEPRDEKDCGVCDNCLVPKRPQDVSFEAWQTVMAASDVQRNQGRCTLAALAELCRGLGGAQYKVADEAGRASNATAALDLEALGGKLGLSRENAERLLVQLLLGGYLTETFQATAYTVNVYIAPGRNARKLLQHGLSDAKHLRGVVHLVLHDKHMDLEAKRSASPAKRPAKRQKSEPIEID